MNERSQYKNRIELLQGTLDMLVLQTLQWRGLLRRLGRWCTSSRRRV